ncbi:penicillin-binding protein 1A [Desulfoscipio sp. XC116]|uniref:transglycosylase domain-containing protein n=1 Tax=Desulfoscipio sp. XC116 TaxID=3144975 RepID=UPI00325BE7D4
MTAKKKRKKRKLNPTRFILFILIILFLISAGALAGLLLVSIKDLPAFNEANLIPATTTQIYDSNNKLVTQIGVENRTQVSLNKIPLHVQEAFLAAEDHLFYKHHGIRVESIARAAINDALHIIGMERNFQGASTITQQLVKLSFLNPERTIKRKIQEAILSFKMENRYSKEEILAMYLNRIYFGEGAYGVQAAAQTYFGRDAGDLTIAQGALLAGLIRSPNNYSPYQNMDAAISHRDQVLDNMYRYNFISEGDYQQAKTEEVELKHSDPSASRYPYPYFVDYVTEQLADKFGDEKVFRGGLKVYTTLDPQIQTYAEKALANNANFPASQKDSNGVLQPQGAMVIMDPGTGDIKALVGGREHTHQRSLNRATMSPRQPGSAIKPILAYGPAIEFMGMAPASVIDDAPVTYNSYGNYSPRNSGGGYRGLITLRTALTHSVNIAAVKLLMDHVKIPNAVKFAAQMNINIDPTGPAIALGGLTHGVTPIQLTAAYATFANNGIYNNPTSILRVEDYDGTVLFEAEQSPHRAMKETTAYLMTDMMKSVVQSGTGTGAQIGRPAAGKTGTTDEGKDIWFAGYTRDLVGVVWIGYDIPVKMPTSYGGTYPAKIWREVMQQAHQGIESRDFIRPQGLTSATVDSKSGLLPGPNTPPEHMVTDLFASGTVPTKTDDVHVLTEVCATTGLLPNQYCPERITRVMLKLPYTVSPAVADYNLRVPTKICDVHGVDSFVTPEETDDAEESMSNPERDDSNEQPIETPFKPNSGRFSNNTDNDE